MDAHTQALVNRATVYLRVIEARRDREIGIVKATAVHDEVFVLLYHIAPRLELRDDAFNDFAPTVAQCARKPEIVARRQGERHERPEAREKKKNAREHTPATEDEHASAKYDKDEASGWEPPVPEAALCHIEHCYVVHAWESSLTRWS